MKGGRLLLPAVIAAAGIVSLLLLFPRFDPSARLHAVLDREQAIAKTRLVASTKGVNTDGWQALAVEWLDTPTGPLKLQVSLSAPGGKSRLDAIWNVGGALERLRLPGAAPLSSANVVSISNDGGNVHVHVDTKQNSRDRLSYGFIRVVEGLWELATVIYFGMQAFRRRLRYREAIVLTVVLIVGAACSSLGGTLYQHAQLLQSSVRAAQQSGDSSIDVTVGGTGRSNMPTRGGSIFWFFLYAVTGISIRGLSNQRKWHSLEMMARGDLTTRAVGWSVAVGLMCGIGMAAIPYWMAAVFRGGSLMFRGVEVLAAPFPAGVAWDLTAGVAAMGVFGCLLPRLTKSRRPAFRWGLFGVVGIAVLGRGVEAFSTPGANLCAAALLFGAYSILYLKADLLAAITAMVSAQAVLAPCLLLAQPGGSVRALAVPLLLTWMVALAASCHFALRGREGEELPSAALPEPLPRITKTGRMRLHAEFEVARKAQQDALPAAPPVVDGYSIAGSCEPAQQVGGDLFDYFWLADGRLGIAVADVSGKGVPAALYMMVTKGLLAAATRDSSDLGYILQQINRHLYNACKKKVFVTLAAVALDPAARRLQHGRAGHNPILWRRADRGETVVLKPPGLGLGLAAGERFNRGLKIEELQLAPGDAIVLYSDGITEAMNASLELFGDARLIRAVESTDGQAAEESRVSILRVLEEFTNGTPARDDVTLVVLRVAQNGVLT